MAGLWLYLSLTRTRTRTHTVTGGKHQMVPADIKAEAIQYAKEANKELDSEDEDA